MRVRNLDSQLDWTFGQSDSNYAKKTYAVVLDVKMRLKEWYQDCFFALNKGIPWNIRLGSHNQKVLLDRDIKNTALDTNGVLNIFNFESSVTGRRYRAQFSIYTPYSSDLLPVNFEFNI